MPGIKTMCAGVMGEKGGEIAVRLLLSSRRLIGPPTEYGSALTPTKLWTSISHCTDGKQMSWDSSSLEFVLLIYRNALEFSWELIKGAIPEKSGSTDI